MTTLQSLSDTIHIRQIPDRVMATTPHQRETLKQIQGCAERILYPKLCKIAQMIGEPLPVNTQASPDCVSSWITQPLKGYEIIVDETTSLHLCYHEDQEAKNLYLIGKPQSKGHLWLEWFQFTPDDYLIRYTMFNLRNSPDIGLFAEQCKNYYVARKAPNCWVQSKMYDQLEVPWDFSIQSKTFEIAIPKAVSYYTEDTP